MLILRKLKLDMPNENIKIVVKDTGIGIDNKQLDIIFGRFQQVEKTLSRNAEGSGIGLSLNFLIYIQYKFL